MHAYGGENMKKELAILIMAFVVSMSFIGAVGAVNPGQWQGHGQWQGGHGQWHGGGDIIITHGGGDIIITHGGGDIITDTTSGDKHFEVFHLK